jgi:hypothetical protein
MIWSIETDNSKKDTNCIDVNPRRNKLNDILNFYSLIDCVANNWKTNDQ